MPGAQSPRRVCTVALVVLQRLSGTASPVQGDHGGEKVGDKLPNYGRKHGVAAGQDRVPLRTALRPDALIGPGSRGKRPRGLIECTLVSFMPFFARDSAVKEEIRRMLSSGVRAAP
jgi:hypothetical protein